MAFTNKSELLMIILGNRKENDMLIYLVETYLERGFWTEDKETAIKEFNEQVAYHESEDIETSDDFVKLFEIDLIDFGLNYKSDLDINDQLDGISKILQKTTWTNDEDGFLERKDINYEL